MIMWCYRCNKVIMSFYRRNKVIMSCYRCNKVIMSCYRCKKGIMSCYRCNKVIMSCVQKGQSCLYIKWFFSSCLVTHTSKVIRQLPDHRLNRGITKSWKRTSLALFSDSPSDFVHRLQVTSFSQMMS